jgi:hypothetical protein
VKSASAVAVFVVVALGAAPHAGGGVRDDTEHLQAQLDAGGTIFLPKLPNGECYRTRGLWVSRDGTSITSDGACIVALGPGDARIKTGEGRPVRANAVFFLNHSSIRVPPPVRVTISGLHITVPASRRMHGILVAGHETTLTHLTIDGSPLTDVLIGAGKRGSGGMTTRIAVTDSTLSGGRRNVIAAFGPIGLRVEGNTLSGARGTPPGQPAAGIHIRAADRGQPTLDVRVARNRILGNAGPGILLELDPKNGALVLASGIEISGNQILRNAAQAPPARRGGIVLAGGQNDGEGRLLLTDNVVRGNRGPGVLRRKLRLRVTAERNDLRGNTGGATKGSSVAIAPGRPESAPSVPPAAGPVRDDTSWLQARLDRRGGTIFLPKLPNGECYATRGLWVSHDDTTITSDGACIVSLGLGPVRLRSIDGDPIASSAVFFVNRSSPSKPAPVRVSIGNLRIVVPAGQSMFGVAVFGHQTTLSHLDIGGSPKDDITISGRGNGNGYAGSISVLDSTLSGASRNAISATAVIGLRIEGNTIQGVRDSPPGQPAAGIDVEPDDRGQPAFGIRIVRNTIQDNAGPGILLELEPNEGPAVLATDLEISGNTIVRNSVKPSPPKRAGIVLAGGQDGGGGTLVLKDNVIRGNGGPGILGSRLTLVVQASGNDLAGNEGGPSRGF